jgi:hypothetical protein
MKEVHTFGGTYSLSEIEDLAQKVSLPGLVKVLEKLRSIPDYSIQDRMLVFASILSLLRSSLTSETIRGTKLNYDLIVGQTSSDVRDQSTLGTVESRKVRHKKDLSQVPLGESGLQQVQETFYFLEFVVSKLWKDLSSKTSDLGLAFWQGLAEFVDEQVSLRAKQLEELESIQKQNGYFARQRRKNWPPRVTKEGRKTIEELDRINRRAQGLNVLPYKKKKNLTDIVHSKRRRTS